MKHLTARQIEALKSLSALWASTGWCLIGASALACFLDMRWRQTGDLDLVLAVGKDAFPAGLDTLEGWTREVKEHEWHGPGSVQVDVLPAGPKLLEQGYVQWDSGHRMSLVGMRLVFAHAAPMRITDDLAVDVAPLHVIALLKIVAYQDRPHQREKDLEDLGYILEEYVSAEDERRWAAEVPLDLDFECRPAFLLGFDLAPLLNADEREVVAKFIGLLRGEGADTTRSRFLRKGPPRWRADDANPEARLDATIDAFEEGLLAQPSLGPRAADAREPTSG